MKSILLRVAAAAGCLALGVSCIESSEEYWIEADGSGRGQIAVEVPATALALRGGRAKVEAMLDGFLNETREIHSAECRIDDGERPVIHLRFAFDSAIELAKVRESEAWRSLPAPVRELAGDVSLSLRGRTVSVERVARPAKIIPGSGLLPAAALAGRRLETIVHLPAPAISHNATRSENGGQTLVWDIPLAEAVKGPLVQSFEMRAPIPWRTFTAISLPVCVAGLWFARRLRRGRSGEKS